MKNIRNKPCPCGSGKKEKKCCGSAKLLADLRNEQIRKWREEMVAAMEKREIEERERKEAEKEYREKNKNRSSVPPSLLLASLASTVLIVNEY